jgi:hypothetical protein
MTLLLSPGNNASTTLANVGGISSSAVAMTLTAATNFPVIVNPGDYFYATLADAANDTWEVVRVTATSGTSFTILRGRDGTTALTWAQGSVIEMRMNTGVLRDIVTAAQAYATAMSIVMG